jgi:hypothetical protein
MKLAIRILLVTFFLVCQHSFLLYGQSVDNPNQFVSSSVQSVADTIAVFPTLAETFYNAPLDIDKNYDYQVLNKKRLLQVLSYEVLGVGVLTAVGGAVLFGCLADNVMPIWSAVVCAISVAGVVVPLSVIGYLQLQKKASAIDVSTLAQVPVNDRLSVNAVSLSYLPNPHSHAYGLGITLKF